MLDDCRIPVRENLIGEEVMGVRLGKERDNWNKRGRSLTAHRSGNNGQKRKLVREGDR